ncbi:MAG: serine/threonine-protein kinase [bacterium]|nr:serine/threonine-protein kinase [bacterium]
MIAEPQGTGRIPRMIGRTLAHYEILGRLGSGGMGDVYRARDTRLTREIALKVLPDDVAADPERRKRFQREARTVAALQHPNIVTIHSVEEDQGVHFLTMELVEGDTLAARIPTGGLPVEEFFSFGIPLADAVATAHENGITHRDLKPANVMIDRKGRLHVLDFGLAKLVDPEAGSDLAKTMTLESHTAEGRILGTAAYMSPEQAEGKPVDHRSDIFSLGIVLYEMATGGRPFRGETQISTLSAILKDDPRRLTELKPDLPRHLGRIVGHCLEKDPDLRYQSARDVRNELAGLKAEMDSGELETGSVPTGAVGSVRRPGRASSVRWWSFAPLLAAVLLVAVWTKTRPASEPKKELAATYRQVTFSGKVQGAALSADGQWLAYVEKGATQTYEVFVQDLNGGSPVLVLDGIEDGHCLQWSPNGAQILATGKRNGEWSTFVVPRLGGNVATTRFARSVDWSPDGTEFVGAAASGVFPLQIWDRGTDAVLSRITIADSTQWHAAIDWSPAPRILVLTYDPVVSKYVVWTVQPDGTEKNRILETESAILSLAWASPTGDAFYYHLSRPGARVGDLMKQPVNPETGIAEGEPTLVTAGIDGFSIAVAGDGRSMAYVECKENHDLWLVERDPARPAGIREPIRLTSGQHWDRMPALSPDGQTIAFCRRSGDVEQIYTIPVTGGEPSRISFLDVTAGSLSFVDRAVVSPAWSPDGETIVFIAESEGTAGVWTISAKGGDLRSYEKTHASIGLTWAPGERILYQRPGNRNFFLLDAETEEEEHLVADESVGWIFWPSYSPDGSTVAACWNRPDDQGQKPGIWSVSLEDGSEKCLASPITGYPIGWSEDGEWIYLFEADSQRKGKRVFRIPAQGGEPEEHLTIPLDNATVSDITPDGNRVVLSVDESLLDVWLVDNFDSDIE